MLPTNLITRASKKAFSRIGLGCAPIGQLNSLLSEEDAKKILSLSYEAGVTYFDTAPLYGFGLSELRVGSFLRELPRDSYFLTTKVGRLLEPRPGVKFDRGIWKGGLEGFVPRQAYDAETLWKSLEESQFRLGITNPDALLIHDLDHWHFDDAAIDRGFEQLHASGWKALEEMRSSGLAESGIGAGMNEIMFGNRFLEFDLDFFLVAGRMTLLENTAPNHPGGPEAASELDSFLNTCMSRGVKIVVGGVFNSGILVTGTGAAGAKFDYAPAPDNVVKSVKRIEEVCKAHNVPLPAAALQYPFRHPSGVISAIIPGADTPEQVKQNIAWAKLDIPEAFWNDLKTEGIAD